MDKKGKGPTFTEDSWYLVVSEMSLSLVHSRCVKCLFMRVAFLCVLSETDASFKTIPEARERQIKRITLNLFSITLHKGNLGITRGNNPFLQSRQIALNLEFWLNSTSQGHFSSHIFLLGDYLVFLHCEGALLSHPLLMPRVNLYKRFAMLHSI